MKTIPGLFFFLLRLAKDRRARCHRLMARLLRDEEGAWLISMTIMLPVLIGVAGLGTEGGMLFYQHRSLQSAADSAAYSAAIHCSYVYNPTNTPACPTSALTTQAQAVVASYGYTLGTGTNQANVTATATTVPLTAGGTLPAVQVAISRPQSAIFSSIYVPSLSNSVSATAVLIGGSSTNSSASGGCVLALGNTSTGNNLANAISLQGNPSITVNGCGIFSDSTDCVSGSYSESLGGNATITAGSLGSAGCTNIFGNAQVTLPNSVTCNSSHESACTQSDGTISDPYAGASVPSSPSACTQTNYSPSLHSTTIALPAGRYCGTTQFHGTGGTPSTITLSAGGVYIFDSQGASGTTLDLKKVTLTDDGAGATLVFTCSTCSSSSWPSTMMATDSNSTMCVTAPSTGTTAGFVVMGDPAMPLNTTFSTWANGQNYFNGTVYVPSGSFSWGGNATTAPTACNYATSGVSDFCLQLIANQIILGGTAGFGGSGCSLSGGSGGQKQKPIGSTSVTLVD
jgi:Flp pilus assembly protein TadG